jgi:osmoprotectant transport system permease protein
MRELNARVEVRGEAVPAVARDALRSLALVDPGATARASGGGRRGSSLLQTMSLRQRELLAETGRHLMLVGLSLAAAILVALPLGLVLDRTPTLAEPVIRAAAVIETVPSIALLAFMIPLLGIGVWPALVALWLYGLYPILRHTYSGIRDADPAAVNAARALGMTPGQVLRHVRTPLASPSILAGIRTAAVINVGTATLAAFVGAGGLGEPIATGLALADRDLILAGALPAAALALLVDGVLALAERSVTPEPLRQMRRG